MKRRRFTKVVAVAAILAMVLGMTACSGKSDSDADKKDSKKKTESDSGKHTDIYESASELYKEGEKNKVGITVIDNVIRTARHLSKAQNQ